MVVQAKKGTTSLPTLFIIRECFAQKKAPHRKKNNYKCRLERLQLTTTFNYEQEFEDLGLCPNGHGTMCNLGVLWRR